MHHSTSPANGGRLRRSGWRALFGITAIAAAAFAMSAPANAATVNHAPIGHLDSVVVQGQRVVLHGWTADPDSPASSTAVRIEFNPNLFDRQAAAYVDISHDPRPDVAAAHPGLGPNHGFNSSIAMYKTGVTTACAYGLDLQHGPATLLGCQRITVTPDQPAVGHLDSVKSVGSSHVEIAGWSADLDTPNQPVSINLLLGGANYGGYYNIVPGKAALPRSDVAQAYPKLGPNHGFDITIAARPGSYQVCGYGFDTEVNRYGGTRLGCIAVTVIP